MYITTIDIVIPKGTQLKEWKGQYAAVIGISDDSVGYFSMFEDDIEQSNGIVILDGVGNHDGKTTV